MNDQRIQSVGGIARDPFRRPTRSKRFAEGGSVIKLNPFRFDTVPGGAVEDFLRDGYIAVHDAMTDEAREGLIDQIVTEKIPFAIDEWVEFEIEQEEGKTMSFDLLLEFLEIKRRAALKMFQMQSRSRVSTISFQGPASSGSGSNSSLASVEDGSSAWERRTRRRRHCLVPRPNPAPPPPVVTTEKTTLGQTAHCHWCKEGHWLKSCPRFLQLSIS